MDTRSGELLSAAISLGIATSTFVSPNSEFFRTLTSVDALPEWAIAAMLCALFCTFAVFTKSIKTQMLSRFLSGSAWGTLILCYAAVGQSSAILYAAVVLFGFDIFAVTQKRNYHDGYESTTDNLRQ